MPALNFQKRFAPDILSGKKLFTLRELRKDGLDPKAGQALYFYTSQRSKDCKKIAEKVCRYAVTIRLCYGWIWIPGFLVLIHPDLFDIFSRADGFNNYEDFCLFHKIKDGMKVKQIRLISWVTREELKMALHLTDE